MGEYKAIFIDVLEMDNATNFNNIKMSSNEKWDSLAQITLISELEDKYNVSFDSDDILDFDSFDAGIKLLSKYGVDLSE